MCRHHSQPDFDCEPGTTYPSWLYPPSPFADLLRLAFAPEIDYRDILLRMFGQDIMPAPLRLQWDAKVVHPFALRYQLWPD